MKYFVALTTMAIGIILIGQIDDVEAHSNEPIRIIISDFTEVIESWNGSKVLIHSEKCDLIGSSYVLDIGDELEFANYGPELSWEHSGLLINVNPEPITITVISPSNETETHFVDIDDIDDVQITEYGEWKVYIEGCDGFIRIETDECMYNDLQTCEEYYKEKFNVKANNKMCIPQNIHEQITSELNSLRSIYNITLTNNTEQQHTITKLTKELSKANKKIEELDTREQQRRNEGGEQPPPPVNVPTQTISINVPESIELDNTDRTIDLYTDIDNRIRIDTYYSGVGTAYHINDKVDITMFRDTWITSESFVSQGNAYCYVGDLLVGQSAEISRQHTDTLQLEFRQSTDPNRCDGSPDITFDGKLSLSKEVYVRFVGMDGQVPFYYTESDTIDIPKCTDSNFNSVTNELIGDTEICYGKDDSDIVLVSKILTVFGV